MEIKEIYTMWSQYNDVCVFGYGHVCKNSISKIKQFCNVKYILDNNAKLDGEKYQDIEIKFFDKQLYKNEKILISTHYKEIRTQLLEYGLKEDVDFCAVEKYITIMEWFKNDRVYVNEVHTSITTKCTLNCDKCNMFMADYTEPFHLKLQNIKDDFDTFFNVVDEVSTLALLGGEPLLYPDISQVLEYLAKYQEKIGRIEIITNGTIIPNNDLLQVIKKYHIFLRISDYSNSIPYMERLRTLEKVLREQEVEYYINSSLYWLDFGFPQRPLNISDDKVYSHMIDCAPAFKGLNDKKLYYCHIVWSADKCGLYKEKEHDYIDLISCSREEVVKYALGIMEHPVSLCKYCAGCSSDNKDEIQVGKQRKR